MFSANYCKDRIKILINIYSDLPEKRKYLTLPVIILALSSILSILIPLVSMQMLSFLKNGHVLDVNKLLLTGSFWIAALIIVAILEYYQKLLFRKYSNIVLERTHYGLLKVQYLKYQAGWWTINSKEKSDEVLRDLEELYPFYAGNLFDFLRNYVVIMVSIWLLILINLKLTLVLVSLIPFYIIIHIFWYSKLKTAYFICREASQKYLNNIVEFFQTIQIINIYDSLNYERERVLLEFNNLLQKKHNYLNITGRKLVLSRLLSSIAPLYLFFCVFVFIQLGWSSFGEVVGFWGIFSLLLSSVNSVSGQSASIINAMEVYNKMKKSNKNIKLSRTSLQLKINNVNEIDLQNIVLSFNEGSSDIFYPDINIKKGEWLEICGRSGIGKTSLIRCILGQLQPLRGQIKINGFNINEIEIGSYLKQIGYVEQNGYIYSRTIKENIILNRPYDSFLFERIINVARLKKLIMSKSSLESQLIGENGAQLSGGEKQRILIARALYHEPKWLIMDEPFSGLDKANINELLAVIQSLREDFTLVVVSHQEIPDIKFDKRISIN